MAIHRLHRIKQLKIQDSGWFSLIVSAKPRYHNSSSVYLILFLLVIAGCSIFDSDRDAIPLENPPNMQLFATVFGQGQGLWTFDTQSLEVQDTLFTGSSWSINFSPDYRILFTSWRVSELNTNRAYAIDRTTGEIVLQQELWNPNVHLSRNGNYLFSMGSNPGIQVLDSDTFEILFEGYTHLMNHAVIVASSPVNDEVYVLVNEDGKSGVSGVMVFNTKTFNIDSIIPLSIDETRRKSMQGSYIDISPNGNYVFVTVFNWQGGGGYGSFHVIDIRKKEQVFEAICSGFAWMGVSPDGKYVYLSDSAGTPYNTIGLSFEFPPNNTILRYDVIRKRMETFINGGSAFGLTASDTDLLITSSIAVAPDNRSMFIRVLSAGSTLEGNTASIIQIDTRSRELLNYYQLPPDQDGFVRALIHQLKIGRKPN